ncbi:MAG: zinc ribbon domain-containing protein, partial [Leifsonia sp.]
MTCPSCGAPTRVGATFCGSCGARLVAAAATTVAVAVPAAPT